MRTFKEYLQGSLEDKKFAEVYEETKADVEFGIALARQREALGLTQQQVAASTGIKQPMLARIERGQMPKAVTLRKLAKALNIGIVFTADGTGIVKLEAIAMGVVAHWVVERLLATKATKIPLGKVVDLQAYKDKKKPLTAKLKNNEVNYESIKSVVG